MVEHKMILDLSKNNSLILKTEYFESDDSVKINFFYKGSNSKEDHKEKFELLSGSNRRKNIRFDLVIMGDKQIVKMLGHVVFFQKNYNNETCVHFTMRCSKWDIDYDNKGGVARNYKIDKLLN